MTDNDSAILDRAQVEKAIRSQLARERMAAAVASVLVIQLMRLIRNRRGQGV